MSNSRQFTPIKNNKLAQVIIAITIGTLGGLIFAILKLPLPWMLGAMVFVTVAAGIWHPSSSTFYAKAEHGRFHRSTAWKSIHTRAY